MKKTIIAFAALFSATAAHGHTPAESNEVVSAALTRAAFYYDDLREGSSPPDNDPPPTTWLGFLGPETNGWTLAGKMAAFDRYLSTLVTNDCKSLDYFEQLYAAVAVGKCEEFNYTNSASAMKTLAINPRGIERHAEKLRQDTCTNGAFARAVSMFYRNRKASGTGAVTLDRLFADKIDGYALSSNRLDTALSMLTVTNMRPQFVEYFTGVTNQLLSSGQPLPWINFCTGGN